MDAPKKSIPTKIERERRIHAVQNLIIEGIQDYKIILSIKKKWDVSRRTAQRYLASAYLLWKQDLTIDLLQRRDARIAELQQDIRGMDEKYRKTPIGLRMMLAYKKEISKLEDLYPSKRLIHSGDPANPVKIQSSPFLSEQDEIDYKKFLLQKYNSE